MPLVLLPTPPPSFSTPPAAKADQLDAVRAVAADFEAASAGAAAEAVRAQQKAVAAASATLVALQAEDAALRSRVGELAEQLQERRAEVAAAAERRRALVAEVEQLKQARRVMGGKKGGLHGRDVLPSPCRSAFLPRSLRRRTASRPWRQRWRASRHR